MAYKTFHESVTMRFMRCLIHQYDAKISTIYNSMQVILQKVENI